MLCWPTRVLCCIAQNISIIDDPGVLPEPLLSSGVLQRNDLRRARMELAAATEDANQTRQELRVARAELARSRAQQATVCCPAQLSCRPCG